MVWPLSGSYTGGILLSRDCFESRDSAMSTTLGQGGPNIETVQMGTVVAYAEVKSSNQ